MNSNSTDTQNESDDSLCLRDLRRVITRHRRQHELAERSFHEWQSGLAKNDRDIDDQLTRISNRLTNRLQRQAMVSEAGEAGVDCN